MEHVIKTNEICSDLQRSLVFGDPKLHWILRKDIGCSWQLYVSDEVISFPYSKGW